MRLLLILLLAGCSGGSTLPRRDAGSDVDLARAERDLALSCATAGEPCAQVACCGGLACANGTCVNAGNCKPQGAGCLPTDLCCNGNLCNSFDAVCEACSLSSGRCTKTSDCCKGLTCNLQTNYCQGTAQCGQIGAGCTGAGDCCSTLCNGATKQCATCGASTNAPCAVDGDCCANQGWSCNLGLGRCEQPPMCGKNGANCLNTVDCCQGYYCETGACTNTPMCHAIGAFCAQYTDCCEAASMDCPTGHCCIESLFQDLNMIKCYGDGDCCNNEKCIAGKCTG